MTHVQTSSELEQKNSRPNLDDLEQALHYCFQQKAWLEEALTHRSYVHESKERAKRSYERLEFLGDAVLELAVSYHLWQEYPNLPEGDLTRMRAELVKKMTLATIGQRLNLGAFVRLGRGEKLRGGMERASILADTLEALLGAIFLDGGFAQAQLVCLKLLEPELERLDLQDLPNYKNRLQELAASQQWPMPRYQLLHVHGPEHEPVFVMEALIPPESRAEGYGQNKKSATQEAAKQLLAQLQMTIPSEQTSEHSEHSEPTIPFTSASPPDGSNQGENPTEETPKVALTHANLQDIAHATEIQEKKP